MNIINKNKSGKIIILFIAAMAGVLLLILGVGFDNQSEDTAGTNIMLNESTESAKEYAREVETRISEICSEVNGVSNVSVAVTLSGGYTAVYAQNSQSSSSGYKNEFVLTGNGSSEKALLVGYSTPQISGVGIVCTGGGISEIRREIIALVSATYGIPSNKIYVAEAEK
jgi:stage III sporulation protein AG